MAYGRGVNKYSHQKRGTALFRPRATHLCSLITMPAPPPLPGRPQTTPRPGTTRLQPTRAHPGSQTTPTVTPTHTRPRVGLAPAQTTGAAEAHGHPARLRRCPTPPTHAGRACARRCTLARRHRARPLANIRRKRSSGALPAASARRARRFSAAVQRHLRQRQRRGRAHVSGGRCGREAGSTRWAWRRPHSEKSAVRGVRRACMRRATHLD